MGKLQHFLGDSRSQRRNCLDWSNTHAGSILQHFGMTNAKPVKTPVNPSMKLCKATDDSMLIQKCILCQQLENSQLYLSTWSRQTLHLLFVMLQSILIDQQTNIGLQSNTCIFRYLVGTINYTVSCIRDNLTEVCGYTLADDDFAGDL